MLKTVGMHHLNKTRHKCTDSCPQDNDSTTN